eukprot:gene12075-15186_t
MTSKTATPMTETELDFKPGHAAGHTEVAYVAEGDQLRLLTCGADGRVDLRDKSTLESIRSYTSDEGSINALAVDYATPMVAVGDNQYARVSGCCNTPPWSSLETGAAVKYIRNSMSVLLSVPAPVAAIPLLELIKTWRPQSTTSETQCLYCFCPSGAAITPPWSSLETGAAVNYIRNSMSVLLSVLPGAAIPSLELIEREPQATTNRTVMSDFFRPAGAAIPLLELIRNGAASNYNNQNLNVSAIPLLELIIKRVRSHLPLRALASIRMGPVAALGSDMIKLHKTKDGSVFQQLKPEGYVRCLAWDPEGTYLAASQVDGFLYIFDVSSETSSKKPEFRKRALPKGDYSSTIQNGLSWHPDGGSLVAAPGLENDVVLYERLSWTPTGWLSEGHTAPVNTVAFCPNGLYIASGGCDGVVCVWDMATNECIGKSICKADTPTPITSLAWSTSGNELAVVDEKGQVAVWEGPIAEDMQGPAVPLALLEGQPISPGQGEAPGSNAGSNPADL